MKNKLFLIVISFGFLPLQSSWASKNYKKLKPYSLGSSFSLSSEAQKTMNIEIKKIIKINSTKFEIPKTALVSFGKSFGIYIFRDKKFKLISVQIIKSFKNKIQIYSEDIQSKDFVAYKGVPLLRVTHLQLSGGAGKGHAH